MIRTNEKYVGLLTLSALAAMVLLVWAPIYAERVWFDGSRDSQDGPPGKLLSDNFRYWGKVVLTGVEYHYEKPPGAGKDYPLYKEESPRKLLDGSLRTWEVSIAGAPLVVVFDFKRPCSFEEIDLATETARQIGVKIECSTDGQTDWRTINQSRLEDCPERQLHRFVPKVKGPGRYLRLTVQGKSISRIEQVWVWGDAEVSDQYPEAYNPVVPPEKITEIAWRSIPGIAKTGIADYRFFDWLRKLGNLKHQPAVWSRVSTWGNITNKPILPQPNEIVGEVRIQMTRNETECMALALTSTEMERPRKTRIELSGFRPLNRKGGIADKIQGKVRVAGAIPSREYGVNLGPLFEADNMLGASLMQKYLTNGRTIAGFPEITLSPSGSAVFWLSVTTAGAKPGEYAATLSCQGGAPVKILVEVLDVTLPDPFVWVQTWSYPTSIREVPFLYGDRLEREVDYIQSLGISVWLGWPNPGTPAALARKKGRAIFSINGLGNLEHIARSKHLRPEDVTESQKKYLREYTLANVKRARQLGLEYDDWFIELWDEPGKKSRISFQTFAGLIRQIDPKVNIYANPCYWIGWGRGAVEPDQVVADDIAGWYSRYVDVSCPSIFLLEDYPRSYREFDAPRLVRAFYTVSAHHAKSEQPEHMQFYRDLGWNAFSRGWNGWGFYSYYSPRNNSWNDLDGPADGWVGTIPEDLPDYQIVYPGPRGPIPTRQSEALREGWEDYRLLTLLKERGQHDQLTPVLKAYSEGKSLESLRAALLQAAAEEK